MPDPSSSDSGSDSADDTARVSRVREVLETAVTALGGEERTGQVEMAQAVTDAMDSGQHLLVQAGTGTGKTHLAIAIARSCIRSGARGRFYNVVDLVNRLETETRNGRQGRLLII